MRRTSALARPALFAAVLGTAAAVLLPGSAAAAPDLRARSWYLESLHLVAAERIATGRGVTVAVLDSGVNEIPELSGRVLPGYDPGGGDGRRDRTGHGTSMAALIAGAGGSGDRLLGVAPGAPILPVYAFDQPSPVPSATIVRLVHHAIDHGARVVDMSFAAPDATPASAGWKRDLVSYADAHRAVLVAASGNRTEGMTRMGRPADVPGVVAVTGPARDGCAWPGSVTGAAAAVAAPAEALSFPTGIPGKETGTASGTSGAAALVSGELALIMSKYPGISSADAINRLVRTARDLGARGRDPVYGFGAAAGAAALTRDVPKAGGNPLRTASPSAASDSVVPGVSTVVLLAGVLVAAVLVAALVLIILVVRARRRRGSGDGGGGGGGGPGGPPPYGPGPGPTGYGHPPQQPPVPAQPARVPVGQSSGPPRSP